MAIHTPVACPARLQMTRRLRIGVLLSSICSHAGSVPDTNHLPTNTIGSAIELRRYTRTLDGTSITSNGLPRLVIRHVDDNLVIDALSIDHSLE